MPIPTKPKIKYTCGHTETRDLSGTPAGKRKSKANWFGQNQTCSKCFKESRKGQDQQDTNQRALDAQSFAEEHELPELTGSDKQVFWAGLVRHEVLAAVIEAQERIDEALPAAQQITWAGWWMENLAWNVQKEDELETEDFAELILTGPQAQAERDETHPESENPFE